MTDKPDSDRLGIRAAMRSMKKAPVWHPRWLTTELKFVPDTKLLQQDWPPQINRHREK